MKEERELRKKLHKIEALFFGTNNQGKKLATVEAIKHIKDKIEQQIKMRCSLQDRWSR